MSTQAGGEPSQAANVSVLIEAALVAMVMVEASGRILMVNTTAERLFGYGRDELLTMRVEELVPERFRAGHPALRGGFFRNPAPRPMGIGRDLFGVRKDGTEIPIEIGLSPVRIDGELYVVASIADITERQRAEQSRREAAGNRLRQSMLDSLPISMIATDAEGRVRSVNPASVTLLGYSQDELVGRDATVLHDPAELQTRATRLSRSEGHPVAPGFEAVVLAGRARNPEDREWTYLRHDGTPVPVSVSVTELHDTDGRADGYLLVTADISARRQAESTIRHMAGHDALTGLPNRELLDARIAAAVEEVSSVGGRLAVLIVNLDDFKRINDTLGHRAGDVLLVEVAHRIQGQLGPRDVVARLGADEFAAMVRDPSADITADPRVLAVTNAVGAPAEIDSHHLQVSPTIGVASFPDDGRDAGALLRAADLAVRHGKEDGPGSVVAFRPEMLEASQARLGLEASLPDALANGELSLVYQPQVALPGRRTVGVETLMRWNRPDLGPVSPAVFIPIAERSDLIVRLGEWTLAEGCRRIAEINRSTGRELRVAINVSPRQFLSPTLRPAVARALESSGLPPHKLELELTEGILMQDPQQSAALLRDLRALGVTIAMDDFGTGYSSLAYLTRFPLDVLKIDQSFVRRLATDPADAAIVDAVIALAHSLGMTVLAEGVETEEQEAYLVSRGCDVGQGYLYSPGVPPDDLVGYLGAEG
ncbi:putative bifunctional diguanylate cyclase/phosphodiesterase [Nocardioides cheoyonin]|uniref:putative bifunctional diguanylate cyclase/phosphodiesterase n=1 Tax=Nocardioides cheoyonin TaxID=3156615 RepID=UPI0032B41FD5